MTSDATPQRPDDFKVENPALGPEDLGSLALEPEAEEGVLDLGDIRQVYEDKGMMKIPLPEFGPGKALWFKPYTGKQRDEVSGRARRLKRRLIGAAKDGDGVALGFVEFLIILAKGPDGNPAFTVEDREWLYATLEFEKLEDIVTRVVEWRPPSRDPND